MATGIRPRPGGRPIAAVLGLVLLTLPLSACLYGFSAGAGVGSEINTIAIEPVLNESDRFDVADEIYTALQADLPGRLGLRPGSEESADAVLRAVLSSYSLSAPNYRSAGEAGAQVLQRQVQLRLQILIFDREERVVLWEDRALSVVGTYPESGGAEEDGRAEAVELLIQRIVDGVQSRW